MAKIAKKQISDVNISENFCNFAHNNIYCVKIMNVFNTFKSILQLQKWLKKLKWRHWVLIALLILITLVKTSMIWGMRYTLQVYPHIASVLSHLSGWVPFAVGDIFIALSITWCILYPIYQIGFKRKKKSLVFCHVAEYLLWVYAWFYLAWGLNYSQPNIFIRTTMMPAKVDKQTLRKFAYRYVDSLNMLSEEQRVKSLFSEELRGKNEEAMFGSRRESQFNSLKEVTRSEVLKGYNEMTNFRKGDKHKMWMGINRPFNQNPHPKTMVFTPLSSMAGVTGSMGPFFCEFTLNGDVLPHDYPSTYAHEFAHFLGVANEGEANFYSYVACTKSKDKAVRFSGYYHIFFHVLANVYDILGAKEGDALLKRINPKIIAMARSDRHYWLSKRCKAIDAAQDFIFDLYLRGNNVKEGRKSYSGVILLILSWEEAKKLKV